MSQGSATGTALVGEEAEESKLGHGFAVHSPVPGNAQLFSNTLLAPSKHTSSPSTMDGTQQAAAETWEVHVEWQVLTRGRYQSFLGGSLLLPPRCLSCQDVVKLIRGFQAS